MVYIPDDCKESVIINRQSPCSFTRIWWCQLSEWGRDARCTAIFHFRPMLQKRRDGCTHLHATEKARLAMMGSRFGIYSLRTGQTKGASNERARSVSVSHRGQLGPLIPAFNSLYKTNLPCFVWQQRRGWRVQSMQIGLLFGLGDPMLRASWIPMWHPRVDCTRKFPASCIISSMLRV
jgi:hypothetical protein